MAKRRCTPQARVETRIRYRTGITPATSRLVESGRSHLGRPSAPARTASLAAERCSCPTPGSYPGDCPSAGFRIARRIQRCRPRVSADGASPEEGCSQWETRVLLCRTAAVLLLVLDAPAVGGAIGPASAVAGVPAGPAALDVAAVGGAMGPASAVAGVPAGPAALDVAAVGGAMGPASAVAGVPAGPAALDVAAVGGAMGPASAVAGVPAGPAALDVAAVGGAMGPASAVAGVPAGPAALDVAAVGGAMGPASAVAGVAAGPAAPTTVPRAATATRVEIVSRASSRTVRSRSATALTRSPLTRRNRERSPAASRSLTRPCTSGP